jgi:hypothetical protein
VHEVLSKAEKPEDALAHLAVQLNRVSRGGHWQSGQ